MRRESLPPIISNTITSLGSLQASLITSLQSQTTEVLSLISFCLHSPTWSCSQTCFQSAWWFNWSSSNWFSQLLWVMTKTWFKKKKSMRSEERRSLKRWTFQCVPNQVTLMKSSDKLNTYSVIRPVHLLVTLWSSKSSRLDQYLMELGRNHTSLRSPMLTSMIQTWDKCSRRKARTRNTSSKW